MSDPVANLLDPGNDWSNRIRSRFTGLSPELADLVLHLGTATQFWDYRYKVDTAWKRRTKALLKAEGAADIVQFAVRELAHGGSFHGMADPEHVIRELGQGKPPSPARSLAVGVLLAAGWVGGDSGLAADLALVARKNAQAMDTYYRVDDRLSGAAFTALGELRGPAAMEELWALHYWVSPSRPPQKVLVKSIKKAAAHLGVPAHEVAERTVPRHGLEADGTLTVGWIGRGALWWNAALDAVVTVHGTGQVTVDWIDEDGTATRTTAPFRSPSGYKTPARADSVDYLRRHAQRIEATLAAERLRLAALAGEGRTWLWPDWVRYYRDHPITGVLARSPELEWEYEVSDGCGYRPLDTAVRSGGIPSTARVRLRSCRRPPQG
ncbi:DUF4132 domain-containing protein [Streptomyces sp. ET3-23]|uniref:DUF4132 domain-containing protein n=1 Tax=Streptomyces sp. ET3-23 TaxID=2885643 RepID=UPI001D1200AC|nr:DUF4132 domain-containing protein [Streptomyces sp. ET3-23]MCC2275381.1 DUF4132 domain-containing protein [Streptomyces sp. ET3-23]